MVLDTSLLPPATRDGQTVDKEKYKGKDKYKYRDKDQDKDK